MHALRFAMIVMSMGHYTIRIMLQTNTYSIKMESSESRFTAPHSEQLVKSTGSRAESCAPHTTKPGQQLFSVFLLWIVCYDKPYFPKLSEGQWLREIAGCKRRMEWENMVEHVCQRQWMTIKHRLNSNPLLFALTGAVTVNGVT